MNPNGGGLRSPHTRPAARRRCAPLPRLAPRPGQLQLTGRARKVRLVLGPGSGVVEVEAAGGVEGVLAGAYGQADEEDRFVVVVVAGAVDRELPVVGGADVAEAA